MIEYKIIRQEFPTGPFGVDKKFAALETTINEMAAQGWELKSIIDRGVNLGIIFARQK